MQRREFFSSLLRPQKREEMPLLFPPYYEDLVDFEKCKECESKPCIEACEEAIIVITDEKPALDFSESGCTFCDECAKVCEPGVLRLEAKKELPKLQIDMLSCLAWQKTICSMCKDICDVRAIDFTGLFNPQISDVCNGCGFCMAVCPTQAIRWEGIT
ncbi:MAG: 4Fe-4S ferredoxin [Epsilonproteobacteria bacterium]|nr:4Fe-4S ferredoxin [Campylobacterota bacterium]NPA64024.1 4Fe-4S ferredoxin [Campylobacterota bacterium]